MAKQFKMAEQYVDIPQEVDIELLPVAQVNQKEPNDIDDRVEGAKRFWIGPILAITSVRLYPHIAGHINFRKGYIQFTCSLILVLVLFGCILLQILMFLAYLTDMVFRPLLFIKMNKGYYNGSNSSTITALIFPDSRDEKYHEFQNWFLFIWNYMYGLIGLYSTVFLFIHAWSNEAEFPGIFKLIDNITKNKRTIRKIQLQLQADQPRTNTFTRFMKCITCSNNQMQMYLDKVGCGFSHFCIVLLSISLVVYWVVLNAISFTLNDDSNSLLSQDSDLALVLAMFDCVHWHLSPVIVCFLTRISCLEITTSLNKLRFEFASEVGGIEERIGDPLWIEFYKKIKKVKSISMKYRRISAINIIVLIFAIVGLSMRYFNKDIISIDRFILYDWLDFIRFFTWYSVHLLSVWFMIDAMSTLNQTVDYFSDEIFLILACKFKIQDIDENVKTQLYICNRSKQRFNIDLFGVVTPTTVHFVIGFGSATLLIFISEALKILIEDYIQV